MVSEPSAALSSGWRDVVAGVLARHAGERGALLAVLHGIQDALGFVPPDAHPAIAEALSLSRAEVHGVVSFYHDFRSAPPGEQIVRICRAEACQAMGADTLIEHAEQRLGVRLHQARPDGKVTLEPVYCLGNCARSPSIMIDGRMHGSVTPERFDTLLAASARKEPT